MSSKISSAVRQAVSIVAFAVIVTIPGVAAHAEEAQETAATPAPTPTSEPIPIPATEIPGRAAAIGPLLRKAISKTDVGEEIEKIGQEFANEQEHLVGLTEEAQRRLEAGGPASIIEEAQNAWLRSASRLDGWLSTLKEHSTTIAGQRQRLDEERELWELTMASADEVELPEALRQQAVDTLAAIQGAQNAVRANRDSVLTLQSNVAREKAAVDEMLADQKEEIALRRSSIVGLDSPPLWKTVAGPGLDGGPSEQLAAMWTKSSESIQIYVVDELDRLVRQALFLALLVIALLVLRRRAALWAQQDRSLIQTVEILERPLAAAFIVTMLLGNIFHPRAPDAWIDLMGLALLLALLRLLPKMLPPPMRSGAYLLALVYFLQKIMHLAPDGNLLNRLALLTLSLAGAASCQWLYSKIRDGAAKVSDGWVRIIVLGGRVAFLVFVAGTVANLIGSVGFAVLVVEGTLESIYAAILFWVGAMLMRAIVRVVLLTKTARHLGLVRLRADTVRRSLFRVIQVTAVMGWAVMTLQGFDAFDATIDGLKKAIESRISIGDFSIVPGDILIFILVVWLTFKISQLLRFVLEADVLPHLDLPRGVPGAVTRLSHYTIVVVGVMIAAVAAGLDFSRINLMVGALGVGIGFGLQNVVNNFVSGLILLFERPIRVGDKVQLATLFGTVKNIGMRASVVRTFQGAEVIVPNANLISAEVVNWTLSDDRRRMELPAGVAYGTDPQVVIDILVGVANDHPEVLSDPEPAALFLGFGDSSLDFQLRAWTRTDYVRVSSDLLVAMNNALVDAGIEIPFPQRDLHLRSVDPIAAEALPGRARDDGK
ncbi:MAG: mechanosensitive ion channel [Acidobacteriota bacterium]|nr:mechanosensitive ion channel [Acidobacteriota bacterium]